jgi:hypothetical protein
MFGSRVAVRYAAEGRKIPFRRLTAGNGAAYLVDCATSMDRPSNLRLLLALALGWLLPGAGHALYGRRDKALYFGVLILLAFAIGLWLGEGKVVSVDRYGLYLLAQIWLGGPTLIALAATRDTRITAGVEFLDAGLLFTAAAGLLNVVVLVDLYELHLRRREPAAPAGASQRGIQP